MFARLFVETGKVQKEKEEEWNSMIKYTHSRVVCTSPVIFKDEILLLKKEEVKRRGRRKESDNSVEFEFEQNL